MRELPVCPLTVLKCFFFLSMSGNRLHVLFSVIKSRWEYFMVAMVLWMVLAGTTDRLSQLWTRFIMPVPLKHRVQPVFLPLLGTIHSATAAATVHRLLL